MLPARLKARCPSALVIGAANAQNVDLEFSKRSNDGSGKATLVSSADAITLGYSSKYERQIWTR
jgi:gamma-glutamylcyclotransferase